MNVIDEEDEAILANAVKTGIVEAAEHLFKNYSITVTPSSTGRVFSICKLGAPGDDWRKL